MSELGLYEGCYVELRNGEIKGPLNKNQKAVWSWEAEGEPSWCWTKRGRVYSDLADHHNDIIRVLPGKPTEASDKPRWNNCGQAQATIPPHVTSAAMEAGLKARPAFEEFVNAILMAGFQAQYGIEFVPVGDPTYERFQELLGEYFDLGVVEGREGRKHDAASGDAQRVFSTLTGIYRSIAFRKNESENRNRDSEKLKGGLSDIPTIVQIDEMIRQCVRDWRLNVRGTATPPTQYIADAVHKMLVDRAGEEPFGLVEPKGWYLYLCEHSRKIGDWVVEFAVVDSTTSMASGRGKDLVEAWQNAVKAVRQYELDRSLDL